MELFKTKQLQQEYKEFSEKIMPSVLKCNYCNVSHCIIHGKFDISCIHCRKIKCEKCFKFNISMNVLLKSATEQTIDYLFNYISDFLNISNESIKKHFPTINIIKKEKTSFKKSYVKSQKNQCKVVSVRITEATKSTTYQNGRWKRKFFY